jgi:RNA polymerase sigma factor (sigma-70 family)
VQADDASGSGEVVAHFFRHEWARLVATLMRRYRGQSLDSVEDAVQGALLSALSTWRRDGVPHNPSAWLFRVAGNRLLDQIRHQAIATKAVAEPPDEQVHRALPSEPPLGGDIVDDALRVLFLCCDERLPAQTQLVLALRFCCGFGTAEIAARLFISAENAQKVLERGRERLQEAWRGLGEVSEAALEPERLRARLPVVQNVVYLLFNEGYSSRQEDEPIRRELCEEALRLARFLVEHPHTGAPSSWALLALLELHTARLAARVDGQGQLLLLEEQDRSCWDRAGIARGMECLWRSGRGEEFSRYHAEAAILAEHCMAPSFEGTRWGEIVSLYEILEQQQPSPFHTLNRAIALAEWQGPQAGLTLLRVVSPPPWLAGYYLWIGAEGELCRRLGRFDEAAPLLAKAQELAPTRAERRIFARKCQRCADHDASR